MKERVRDGLRLILLLSPAILVAGCELLGGDSVAVQVKTNRQTYDAEADAIALTAENRSNVPVYYLCTGGVFLQERSGSRVAKSWMVHGFELCAGRTPIDPGQSVVFAFVFDSPIWRERLADALFDESVHYRFEVDLYYDRALRRPLGRADRLSNRFSIVR